MHNRCYEVGWDVAPSVKSSLYSSRYSQSSSIWFSSESANDCVSDVYRIAQKAMKIQKSQMHSNMGSLHRARFRWILVLVLYFSEFIWISYEFPKFKSFLKMGKGWINIVLTRVTLLLVHVACWHQYDVSMTSSSRLWYWQVGPELLMSAADVIVTSSWCQLGCVCH